MRQSPSLVSALILLLCPLVAAGQSAVRDFGYAVQLSPALELSNPAALSAWKGKISMAELEGCWSKGGLIAPEESSDALDATMVTESFWELSRKLSFHGRLSWAGMKGKDMGGPVFMHPDFHPLNFLESDPLTAGTKRQESYSLCGAFSLRLPGNWAVGLGAEYGAGDRTKVKDPRFSNVMMDLKLTGGVFFSPTDGSRFGLSVSFRKAEEQILGSLYGASDRQYFVMADKGGFFGSVAELTGDMNYISVTTRRPMANNISGISLQALLLDGLLSNELEFTRRSGYYGKKSANSPVFFEFSGLGAAYRGVLLLPTGERMHRIALDAGVNSLENDENVLRYVTPQGGGTIVEYTGSNHILDRLDLNASLGWRCFFGGDSSRPEATAGLDLSLSSRAQTTSLYPFWRKHSWMHLEAALIARKVFSCGASSFIIDLSAGGAFGCGVEAEDGAYASTSSTGLKSFDEWLNPYFEYKTAPRSGLSAGFTYALRTGAGKELYAGISDSLCVLLTGTQHLAGPSRNVLSLRAGTNF